MNLRQAEIAKTFAAWLESYSPPRNIAAKPEAAQREAERLLAVLVKFAPQEGWNGWVDTALDQLAYQMKTRAWPTVAEIGAVCSNLRKSRGAGQTQQPTALDRHELAAMRMGAGEAVAEGYLYGADAVELERRGIVSRETMTRYRSAAFFARAKIHGDEVARKWEAEARDRHEAARAAAPERVAA